MLDGVVLDDVALGIHCPVHRRQLGVVFQQGHLLPHLTVSANLQFGYRLLHADARRIGLDEVVQLLEIGELLERSPRTLSGGQRQRVALGRALLCSPRLLLLDEPLAALDHALQQQIIPYLCRVRRQIDIPILHVSHDLGELLQVCDDLLLLDRGAVVGHGTLVEVANQAATIPLLRMGGMVNILRGEVLRHDPSARITEVALLSGAIIVCALRQEGPGTRIDLLVRPDDIALSVGRVSGISLQNQLPGRIAALADAGDRILVTIDMGLPMLAEISSRSADQLGIAVGAPIHVLFKAVAVSGRS